MTVKTRSVHLQAFPEERHLIYFQRPLFQIYFKIHQLWNVLCPSLGGLRYYGPTLKPPQDFPLSLQPTVSPSLPSHQPLQATLLRCLRRRERRPRRTRGRLGRLGRLRRQGRRRGRRRGWRGRLQGLGASEVLPTWDEIAERSTDWRTRSISDRPV